MITVYEKRKILIIFLLVGALFFYTIMPASAVLFSFDNITNNDFDDAAIGEAQLFVDVTKPGDGNILFTFGNIGTEDLSITDVYFGGVGVDYSTANITGTPDGVSFSEGDNALGSWVNLSSN